MTDANSFRNAAQDRDFLARNAKDQQQASPEAIARYLASFEGQRDQVKIDYALTQYEETRIGARPKPKFILHIDGNHFHARPSRATLWDVLFVAIATATWLALLTSIYLVFK
jgi:hypothetical protein